MAVFLLSLAVALVVGYELLLQEGRRDIDVVLAREHARFDVAIAELLDEERADRPGGDSLELLERAVRRYLRLNPASESYWTIVTLADDGRQLAAASGPPSLAPLLDAGTLPEGGLERRETVGSPVGQLRTSSVPIVLDDEVVGTLQIVAPFEPVRTEAWDATRLLATAAGITLLIGGLLLAASLWRSLTPLTELARTARSTELRSLDARVREPDTADEVGVLAREFNTMLDRLDAARDAQQTFLASVGHELRTPLTIARGHLELLRGDAGLDPGALGETVGIVEEELARMGRLIDDLMAIARIETDDFLRPQDLELVQWFEDLELRLAGIQTNRTVRLVPPPPVTVTVDPDRLAQAVLNLVVNAVRHTPSGTTVEVSARTEADGVVIEVVDDGPGIPEDLRAEVFDPFIHGGQPGSTGLGLAVVRAVTEAHGGRVQLDTSTSGTRVGLWLPGHPREQE